MALPCPCTDVDMVCRVHVGDLDMAVPIGVKLRKSGDSQGGI